MVAASAVLPAPGGPVCENRTKAGTVCSFSLFTSPVITSTHNHNEAVLSLSRLARMKNAQPKKLRANMAGPPTAPVPRPAQIDRMHDADTKTSRVLVQTDLP